MKPLETVSLYSVDSDGWRHSLPHLHFGRKSASGCFVNSHAYVFGGIGSESCLNSIERLSLSAVSSGREEEEWQSFQVDSRILPRQLPVVAALNDTEFVIMGGDDG